MSRPLGRDKPKGEAEMGNGTIFNIQRYSTQDGPGIRTTVFFKGCPLKCTWCHNPEGMSSACELALHGERCIRCGACKEACPAGLAPERGQDGCQSCGQCANACPAGARNLFGRQATAGEVIAEIVKDRIFYDQSGGGATFSGGEPLAQPQFLGELLSECKREGIPTALDTCGYADKDDLLGLAGQADLVLYDLKGHDDARHIANTGVPAAPILDNLEELAQTHKNIWIRLPIIQGRTDDECEMELLALRFCKIKSIKRVVLLPYHAMGEAKLKKLGALPRIEGATAPSPQALNVISEIWRHHGFDAQIGGHK